MSHISITTSLKKTYFIPTSFIEKYFQQRKEPYIQQILKSLPLSAHTDVYQNVLRYNNIENRMAFLIMAAFEAGEVVVYLSQHPNPNTHFVNEIIFENYFDGFISGRCASFFDEMGIKRLIYRSIDGVN